MFNNLYKKCLDLAAHKSSKYYLAFISFVEEAATSTNKSDR